MLFEASTVYAPGEPHGDVGYSDYMNMTPLGRFDLPKAVQSPNLWVGLVGIVALVWLGHRYLGRK